MKYHLLIVVKLPTATFLEDYSAHLPVGEKKIQNTILFNNRIAIAFAECLN